MRFYLALSLLVLCASQIHSYNLRRNSENNDSSSKLIGERIKRQSPNNEKRVVCFYASWSNSRKGPNKFSPEDLNPSLCTHLMYGYARLDSKEGVVEYDTKFDVEEKGWNRFIALKKRNPDAKMILAVGGLFEGSARFSRFAGDPKERIKFARSAAAILRENGFDGIEISWVYPGFSEGSSTSDKQNYPLLLKELREELGNNFVISVTVPGLDRLIDTGYDVPEILKYVDFINVWAGAYHPENAPTVNHPSPLYALPNDPYTKDGNVDATMRSMLKRGAPADKMNLLIANYGLYYVLADPAETDIGAATEDEADNSEWRGGLIYNELCQKIRKEDWTVKTVNATAMGPYAFKGTEWVAWDDETMVRNKARYAKEMNLGGVGFWTVDMDDFKGFCHLVDYPLLRGAREVFLADSSPPGHQRMGEEQQTKDRITFHDN